MNKGCGIELCGPGFCRPSSLCQDCQIGKGSFMWAVEQMKQGKKVRRRCWSGNCNYLYFRDDGLLTDGLKVTPRFFKNTKDFEATDWEIVQRLKFGMYEIMENGSIYWGDYLVGIKDEFDNLEKAIKRARELK